MILRDVILAAQHGGAPRPPQMVARLSDFAKRGHERGTDPRTRRTEKSKSTSAALNTSPRTGNGGFQNRYADLGITMNISKVPQFHLNHSNIVESIEVDLKGRNGVDKCVPAGRGRAVHETLTDRSKWRRGKEARAAARKRLPNAIIKWPPPWRRAMKVANCRPGCQQQRQE